MLEFEDQAVIDAVMNDFDPTGDSHIDYAEFCHNVMGSGHAAEHVGNNYMRQTVPLSAVVSPAASRQPSRPEVTPASDLFATSTQLAPLHNLYTTSAVRNVREEIWRQALETPLSRVATALSTPASTGRRRSRRSAGGGSSGVDRTIAEEELTSAELISEFAMLNASELTAGVSNGDGRSGESRRQRGSSSRLTSTAGSWR